MSRTVETAGAAAARQMEAERAAAARRAAAAQQVEALAAQQAAMKSVTQALKARAAPRDEFKTQDRPKVVMSSEFSAPAAAPARPELPKDPAALSKLFPELKDAPREKLKVLHESMTKLTTGDFSEKAKALGELTKTFPTTTQKVLDTLGVKDSRLAKLATQPQALGALATLTQSDKSVADKAKAALELATSANTILKPEELKGVLDTVFKGLPAGANLAGAIASFMDPKASATDKAKASLELAQSLKDFAGDAFPKLSNDLRKLDGSFRAVSASITLLDPKSSGEDKALAAAQLAVEIPDLKKDLTAFKNVLKQFNVKDADQAVEQGGSAAVKGLDPALASTLTPEQSQKLATLAEKVGPDKLEKVLRGIKDPKALENLEGQLGKLDTEVGGRLLTMLDGMEHGALALVLGDETTAEQVGSLAKKLDPASAQVIGKLAKDMDPAGLGALLKFTDKADATVLKTGIKLLGGVLDKVGGKLVGKVLQGLDQMLGKLGVKVSEEVAGKIFKTLVKIIPLAGAIPNVIDVEQCTRQASDLHGKNKDLGYFAHTVANLNGADALVGTTLDLTGLGMAVDVPSGVLFGAAELTMELAFDSEKAKFDKDPKGYHAPDWMKASNLGAAALMVPLTGPADLVAYYGIEGAAQLTQWGVEKGTKGALDMAKSLGSQSAQATEEGLEQSAELLHLLADVLRNPKKYGTAVANAARETLHTALREGGALAAEARKVVGGVVDEAKKLGQKGLATLQFIGQHPGEFAKLAVDGIQSMVTSEIDLTTETGKAVYKKAIETLTGLQQGWSKLQGGARQEAQELITRADEALSSAVDQAARLGEQGVELVAWSATHPGEVGARAKQVLTSALAQGGALARKTWDSIRDLGAQGLTLAEGAVKSLQQAGGKAVETLQYVASHPGEAASTVCDWVGQTLSDMARQGGTMAQQAALAIKDFVDRGESWARKFAVDLLEDGVDAFQQVAKEWTTGLTEGGKAVLDGLEDLGDAGVDALEDLAHLGGQLAQPAMGHLEDMARAGVSRAHEVLHSMEQLEGEVGQIASESVDALKRATDGEFTVGSVHLDLNPFH